MNFLKYIELSAENLQFYLWFRDYSKRFSELPENERNLSPEWTGEKANFSDTKIASKTTDSNSDAAAILNGTDFAAEPKINDLEKNGSNPFFTPPRTPNNEDSGDRPASLESSQGTMSTGKVDHAKRAAGAFENAGLKWKPCE